MTTKAKPKPTRAEMCRANGCPNRWTIKQPGKWCLCTAHANAAAHLWPIITREQIRIAELVKGKA